MNHQRINHKQFRNVIIWKLIWTLEKNFLIATNSSISPIFSLTSILHFIRFILKPSSSSFIDWFFQFKFKSWKIGFFFLQKKLVFTLTLSRKNAILCYGQINESQYRTFQFLLNLVHHHLLNEEKGNFGFSFIKSIN